MLWYVYVKMDSHIKVQTRSQNNHILTVTLRSEIDPRLIEQINDHFGVLNNSFRLLPVGSGDQGVIFEFQEWLVPLKCILEAFGTGVPSGIVTVKNW